MSSYKEYYDNDGNIYKEVYHSNDLILFETFYTNGIMYREGLPSYIGYNIYGNVSNFTFTNTQGELHKIDGPSTIRYDIHGVICELKWFYKGENYTNRVNKWLFDDFKLYEEMTSEDYNRMWMEIL